MITNKKCDTCGGYGVVRRSNQGYGKSSTKKCPDCNSSGHLFEIKCSYCGEKAFKKLRGIPYCDSCLENMAYFENEN